MAMDEDAELENVTLGIERILNQTIGDTYKQWYELINISENYAENYDDNNLMDKLDELLEDKIVDKIRNVVFGMSVNQKQAALTTLQNIKAWNEYDEYYDKIDKQTINSAVF